MDPAICGILVKISALLEGNTVAGRGKKSEPKRQELQIWNGGGLKIIN